jgi:hypothetical protein
MDTIAAGRYTDTNQLFEQPTEVDYHIKGFMSEKEILDFANQLKEERHV